MLTSLIVVAIMKTSPSFLGPIPTGSQFTSVKGAVQGSAKVPPLSPQSGKGLWIWAKNKEESVRFFKSVECRNLPKKALARVTAESSYRLYINGQIVSRGPADVGRDYDQGPTGPWLYDVVDIRRFLKKGANSIGIEVISRPMVQSEGAIGKPGLWFEADLGELQIGSDRTWLATKNRDFSYEPGGDRELLRGKGSLITLSGLRENNNWFDGNVDGWEPATVVPEAHRNLTQSEIAPPMEAVYPVTGVERAFGGVNVGLTTQINADGGYSVRYDRVLSGHILVQVDGGEGAVLCVMPNEKNVDGFHRAVRLKLGKGRQYFEVPFFDSFSVINLQAVGVTKSFKIESVQAVFRSYPLAYKGQFSCSDPELNRIWEAGRWLTQICMQTHHLDSPHHQEPISDPGDYLIQSLISYSAFGESGLARQDLRKYAQIIRTRKGKVFHTTYALLWLQMLVAYWDHTGDDDLVRELAPTAYLLVDTWETWRGTNGLISNPPNFMFIDWVELEDFNLHHPPAVIGQGVLSAFYYRALEDTIRISDLLGDQGYQAQLSGRRTRLGEAFVRELWDPSKRMFRDGKPGQSQSAIGQWLPADKQIETFSSQVNLLACAYGLVSATDGKEVLRKVMESGPAQCQPYFMHFAFEALSEIGLFNEWAGPQMRRWKIVSDTQSFYEMWDRGDLSHSWQCTPTYQMSSRVLGISPSEPGFKKIKIQPHILDLKWAKGQVPTPFGLVKVNWERKKEDFSISVTVPRGSRATVLLPDGVSRKIEAGTHEFGCKVTTP